MAAWGQEIRSNAVVDTTVSMLMAAAQARGWQLHSRDGSFLRWEVGHGVVNWKIEVSSVTLHAALGSQTRITGHSAVIGSEGHVRKAVEELVAAINQQVAPSIPSPPAPVFNPWPAQTPPAPIFHPWPAPAPFPQTTTLGYTVPDIPGAGDGPGASTSNPSSAGPIGPDGLPRGGQPPDPRADPPQNPQALIQTIERERQRVLERIPRVGPKERTVLQAKATHLWEWERSVRNSLP